MKKNLNRDSPNVDGWPKSTGKGTRHRSFLRKHKSKIYGDTLHTHWDDSKQKDSNKCWQGHGEIGNSTTLENSLMFPKYV